MSKADIADFADIAEELREVATMIKEIQYELQYDKARLRQLAKELEETD